MNKNHQLTESEIHLISGIVAKLAPKYVFGYYSVEDIKQEAFLIAMECLNRYDSKKSSLSTFIYNHVSNKLKTLKRDKYYRQIKLCPTCEKLGCLCDTCQKSKDLNDRKKNLVNTIDIDSIKNVEKESSICIFNDILSELELSEIKKLIDKNLDINLRLDYLKLLDGAPIPPHRKKMVEFAIKEIMENNGYL